MEDRGGWVTKRSRTIFESPWIRIQQDEVALPSGEDVTYTWLHHGGYVVVVPITDDGRVVMERIYRHPLGRTLLECPSGGLDGEDPITAGRRELEEETGYRATSWTHLGGFFGASGHSDERFEVVVARGLSADGELRRESTEQIELELIPLDHLREQALASEVQDGPSALAILLCVAREGA
jgi:ADP-ribose pyrophosphatase